MAEQQSNGRQSWILNLDIATRIKTPLMLLALVVLLVCGIAYKVADSLTSETALLQAFAGIILVIALVVVGGLYVAYLSAQKTGKQLAASIGTLIPKPLREHGSQLTFMSAPMASVSEADYEEVKKKIQTVKAELLLQGQKEVYWGGDAVVDRKWWDRPADALSATVKRIADCDYFVLILPNYACKPVADGYCKPSSIWWEVGMAIAFKKCCIFFVHESIMTPEKIPYYLRTAEVQGRREPIPPIALYRFRDEADIVRHIRQSGPGLFPGGQN